MPKGENPPVVAGNGSDLQFAFSAGNLFTGSCLCFDEILYASLNTLVVQSRGRKVSSLV